LSEVAEELADLYQVFAQESGVTIVAKRAEADKEAGTIFVSGDAHLISQAAANLLDYAIKYSPSGGEVVISTEREANSVSLIIADNGPGIPSNVQKAMLDRYVRGEAAASKPGFGLGLSFVSAVAEWHGARLVLMDNKPGLRSMLVFPLPSVSDRDHLM
jgi:signal transduction histidine kinase